MSRLRLRLGLAATLIALFAALACVPPAGATEVIDGNFEIEGQAGLEGWEVFTSGTSTWEIEESPPSPEIEFWGRFFAVGGKTGTGMAVLYQDIAVTPHTNDELRMAFRVTSSKPIVVPPTTGELSTAQPSQEVRVDLMKPTAPLLSTAPEDILTEVYESNSLENLETSEPNFGPVTLGGMFLSPFGGQTVRLRIAVLNTEGPMDVRVGNVSVVPRIESPPVVPMPTPQPPAPPSNAFTRGTLKLDKKDGTATLAVNVPGAGTLTALDLHSKVALGSLTRRQSKPPRTQVRVRTATATSAAAETVSLPIKPTKAARKLLAQRGTLPISLKLIYTPTGGTAATQVSYGKLRKKLTKLTPAPR